MPLIHCMLSIFLFVSRCESANCPHLFSSASPRLGFPTLIFAAPMTKFIYSGSCCALHQQVPRASLHSSGSVYLAALMSLSAGEMSSDSTSNRIIRSLALLPIHLTSPLCLSPRITITFSHSRCRFPTRFRPLLLALHASQTQPFTT